MAIEMLPDPASGVLRVEGEMTVQYAAEFKPELLAEVAGGGATVLDLSGVGEMDSAGLQLLVLAEHEAFLRKGSLRLAGRSKAVQELLDLYGMRGYFGEPEGGLPVALT